MNNMKVQLRKAEISDCDLLYRWANDKEVRQNSFNSKVIAYEAHVRWFYNKLADDNCNIYVYIVDGKPAGQIRVEYKEGYGIISYSLEDKYRHQGNGERMLKLMELEQKNVKDIKKLIGRVKNNNYASIRCFEKCGYKKQKSNDYIELYKNISQE